MCLVALLALAWPGIARGHGPGVPASPPSHAALGSGRASPPSHAALDSDGATGRYLLGGTWLYRADVADAGLAQGWWRGQASSDGWSPVSMPNAYNAGDFSSTGMTGYVGWYRRDFTLPSRAFASHVPASARDWIVTFESVNYTATVWLNGRKLGSHTGASLPFEFVLRNLRPGVNRLVVRVSNLRTAADLPPGPGGGWWNFGGILDAVYLRPVARADLAQVQIRPVLPCPTCGATVQAQVHVRNLTGAAQTVALSGSYGRFALRFGSARIAPNGTWSATASVRVPHPSLWAPGHPSLYRTTLRLTDTRGRQLGGYVYWSGIRSIKVTSGGRLTLNGRLLDLRGFNLHEQNIASGAALSVAQMRQLVDWARQLGATVIRAHYPLDPEMEQLADQEGVLLWSEIPVYQVARAYLGQPAWRAHAYAVLQDNILANQNHPSVLLWSIGNELPTPATGAEAGYIAGAAALARKLDPTRPVGLAISNWPGVACQGAYAPLDVLGDNEYFGWFDAGGGGNDDRDALSPYLDTFRACYPTKALFISEFGFDGNRAGPVDERGTYEFQANTAAFHLGVFASKPWLSGAIWFALQDYAAFPTYSGGNPRPNPPFNQKGMVDLYGNHKPVFGVVSSIYHGTRQIAPLK